MAKGKSTKKVTGSDGIAAILSALAATQASINLTLSSRKRKLEGRITAFDGRTLLCSVQLSSGVGKILKNIACQADCATPELKCQFATSIAGYGYSDSQAGTLGLHLAVPTELSRELNRDVFRVPCTPDCGLKAELRVDNQLFIAEPLDASFAGLRLGFGKEQDPKLTVGQEVDVTTSFCGWYRLDFKAVVQWAEKGTYGVLIPQFLLDGEFHPPSQWVEVLHGLQVKWSQGRRGVA
jgi:hypothetical protein